MLGAVLAAHLALGIVYGMVVPLWEAPDEPDHYQYAWYLGIHRRLPTEMIPVLWPDTDEAHQPPFYYALAGLPIAVLGPEPLQIRINPYFSWGPGPTRNAWVLHGADEWFPYRGWALGAHAVRVLSALFSTLVVWTVYRLSLLVFPDRPWLAVGAAAFEAFRPGLLASAGSIGNDAIVGFFGCLVLIVLAVMFRSGLTARRSLALGTTYGLALFAKENALALGPIVVLWPIWMVWRAAGGRVRAAIAPLVRHLLLIGIPATLIGGWWFARNMLVYGEPIQRELSGFSELPPTAVSPLRVVEAAAMYNATFWGSFGWQLLFMPTSWNLALAGLLVLAVVGLPFALWRLRGTRQLELLAWLAFAFLLVFAVTEVRRQLSPQPGRDHARYWLPAIAPLCLMLWLGLVELSNRLRLRFAPTAICLGLLGLCLAVPVAVIRPNFPTPVPVRPSIARWSFSHPVQAEFGGRLRLAGYDAPASVRPGEELGVSLYWEMLAQHQVDHSAFVHLVDAAGAKQAQADGPIGTFEYGTTKLLVGEAVRSQHPLKLPPTLPPGRYTVVVGVYLSQAPLERLPVAAKGLGVAMEAVRLAPVEVAGRPDPSVRARSVVYGGALKLTGARFPAVAWSTVPLEIDLDWQSLAPVDREYKLFVHVVDATGRPRAQSDQPLEIAGYPVARWQPGETVRTRSTIRLGGVLDPGEYRVLVGLYDPADASRRLPIASADVPTTGDAAALGPVTVR